MRRKLLLHFLEDHPVAAGLIVVATVALGYLGYRFLFAFAVVMEFTK